MHGEWHYHDGQRQVGPLQLDAIKMMVVHGALKPDVHVFGPGMTTWQPFSSLSMYASPTPAPAPAPPIAHAPLPHPAHIVSHPAARSIHSAPALWNPSAAASWSLLFGAPFGSFLHARNWTTLGETAKARNAWLWFWGTVLAYFFALFSGNPLAPVGISFWSLILWYFISGRPQIMRVKDLGPQGYERKGWGIPLLIGFASMFFIFILALVIVVVESAR